MDRIQKNADRDRQTQGQTERGGGRGKKEEVSSKRDWETGTHDRHRQ